MYFVAGDRRIRQGQCAGHVLQRFLGGQRRLVVQPAQAVDTAGRAFQPERVVQCVAEHLQAAADANQLAAVTQMPADCCFPALRAQPRQIGLHGFRSGQNDQIAGGRRFVRADEAEIDFRMKAQRVEVVVIGNARVGRRDDAQFRCVFFPGIARQCVFGVEVEAVQIRQYAQHRFAGALFQPAQARFEQADIAAEAVDDEALDARLLARREQVERADQMRKNTAAVDVGDQDHRAIHRFGKTHVGDVAVAQVDLGRAAGPFDQQAFVLRAKAAIRFEHRLHRPRLVRVVIAGVEIAQRLAVDDHLRTLVGGGLEQHRIEVRVRLQAGRLRLQRLGAADLAAIDGDRRIERHVLRLEWRNAHATAVEDAA